MRRDVSAVLESRAQVLASKRGASSENLEELITFRLGRETYGLSSDWVGEVFPARDIAELPGVPGFIVGVVNLRGRIISVNDLALILDVPVETESDRFVLVLSFDSMEMGLLVGSPVDVMTVPSDSMTPPIPSSSGAMDYISGISGDVIVLNGAKILFDKKLSVDGEF